MENAVDLAARTDGLLPFWGFLLLAGSFILVVWLAFRFTSSRFPHLQYSVIAIGALILGNILFFWRPLFTAAHMPHGGGDLNSFFFTLHAYSAARIRDGEIPLWNPFLHGGMPHLGNYQAGVLYPPNLIAWLVAQPFSYGTLEWLAILHYVGASVGVYLLMRSMGAGRIGSVAAGLIFSYSGFMVAHLGHYSMISVAAWVPWLLWAINEHVRWPSWLKTIPVVAIVFLMATGGHQQTLLYGLSAAAFWWLVLTAWNQGVRLPGLGNSPIHMSAISLRQRLFAHGVMLRTAQIIIAVGAGLALAAPMLLPSLQVARRSVRSTLSYEQATEFSVQPVALLQLILPTVFGSNPTDYWGPFSSGEIWGYTGVVALVLAVVALLMRPTLYRIVFAAFGVVALLYALGPWTPVHGLVYQFVPMFDFVRAPARAYLFLNLAISVLAGFAISDLVGFRRHLSARARLILRRVLWMVSGSIGVIALFVLPLFYIQILSVDAPPNRPIIAIDNLQILLLTLIALGTVFWLIMRRAIAGALLGTVLTALIVVELFSATAPFNPVDEDLVASYREPDVARFLQDAWEEDGPFRIENHHPGLLPNFGAVNQIHMAAGVFDPMQPVAYTTLHNMLSEMPEGPAYDMLNVRYWLVTPEDTPPVGFTQVFQSPGGTSVWERDDVLPRAWIAEDVYPVTDLDPFVVVRDPAFDPRRVVAIENPSVTDASAGESTVWIEQYELEHILLSYESDGPGYLVLADGDFPDWEATVNGEFVEIETANGGLRAVPVEAGDGDVEFIYNPPLVRLGWLGSGFGVIALAMIGAAHLLRRKIPVLAPESIERRRYSGDT